MFSNQVFCSTWTPATPTRWLHPTLLPRPALTCGGTLTLYPSSEETFALLVFIFLFCFLLQNESKHFFENSFSKILYLSAEQGNPLLVLHSSQPSLKLTPTFWTLSPGLCYFFVLLNASPRVYVMENRT